MSEDVRAKYVARYSCPETNEGGVLFLADSTEKRDNAMAILRDNPFPPQDNIVIQELCFERADNYIDDSWQFSFVIKKNCKIPITPEEIMFALDKVAEIDGTYEIEYTTM